MDTSFEDKYYYFDGTDTIDELNEHISALNQIKSKCYFIKFKGQYYASFYSSISSELLIGKEKVFYSKNGRLEERVIGTSNIGFTVNDRPKASRITDTLFRELCIIDTNMKVYYYPTVNSRAVKELTDISNAVQYIVLLGLGFASKFYSLSNIDGMFPYFKLTPELSSFLYKTRGATHINPFTQEIKFIDGSISKYKITFYYDLYTSRTKATFALTSKNFFAPIQKREWLSLSKYQNLYPDEFILYEKPDFREGKNICKWCGKELPVGRKNYCSDKCRIKFTEATEVKKGIGLPYRILCRDKFICQKCNKDLAMINEYGMKIPMSKLCDTADNDGKYRREAEVHHSEHVEDGGSDNQANLSTRCCDCHKEEHKSRR